MKGSRSVYRMATTNLRSIVRALVVIAVAGALFTAFVVRDMTRRGDAKDAQPVRVTVAEGEGFGHVLADLHEKGLVPRPWTFKFFARVLGHDRHIRRGVYQFTPGTPPSDILSALVNGDILQVKVTIPEGYASWQIAAAFLPAGVDSVSMRNAIADPELLTAMRVPVPTLEGYLFPDTYHIPYGSNADDVVGQMIHRLNSAWSASDEARAAQLGMTRHQVLTLASIIEAEARVDEERPRVSAVYHNRLARGMRLEADPTVAYAMGGFKGRLYYKDLKVESPYNTYTHAGLPPGPICSPGSASIRAALYPAAGEDALYFVARGDGRHVFSSTLREHNAAVQQARRERARQAAASDAK